jgi:glutaminyl-tRNA synthetase
MARLRLGRQALLRLGYYETLYELACKLIRKGLAYVDDLDEEQIKEYRGTNVPVKNNITFTPPGRNSPWRDRSVEENLDLFARMRAGNSRSAQRPCEAKIDMAHPNLLMRDPVMYRIRREPHYRTGTKWCIYPMYDFAHPLSDAIEGSRIRSVSLEYEIHRPLRLVCRQQRSVPQPPNRVRAPQSVHTLLSKRWLLQLVREKEVSGWDGTRGCRLYCGDAPAGVFARGNTGFPGRIGIAKTDSMVDIQLLEHCIGKTSCAARRDMAVLNPVELVIEKLAEG